MVLKLLLVGPLINVLEINFSDKQEKFIVANGLRIAVRQCSNLDVFSPETTGWKLSLLVDLLVHLEGSIRNSVTRPVSKSVSRPVSGSRKFFWSSKIFLNHIFKSRAEIFFRFEHCCQ